MATINIGSVVISEYSTGTVTFSNIIDCAPDYNRVRVSGTIYWTVKDNEVEWYAKCTRADLATYTDRNGRRYFLGNAAETMVLEVDNTKTPAVQVARKQDAGYGATGSDTWVQDNDYLNAETAKISKSKKNTAYSLKIIIAGNGGAEWSGTGTVTATTAFSTAPTINYSRNGTNVTAYVTGTTTRAVTYADPYKYNVTITMGGQSKTVVAKPANWDNSNTTISYTGASNPISITTSANQVSITLTVESDNGGNYSYTTTRTLNVPAVSSISFQQTGITLGDAVAITISRNDNSYTDTLSYVVNGTATTIVNKTSNTSYSWTPNATAINTIASSAPNSKTVTIIIRCTTYNGSTSLGYVEKNLTLTIPNNYISVSISCAPSSSNTTVSGWGVYVQGYSKCSVTVSPNTTNARGATITNYKVSFDGVVVRNASTNAVWTTPSNISKSGTITASATITDSRGYTYTASQNISVYAYSKPTAKDMSCFRSNSAGTASTSGTYITAKATKSYSSVGGNNACSLKFWYKQADSSSWSQEIAMSNNTALTTGGGNILVTSGYVGCIRSIDSLNNYTDYYINVPTGFATIHLKDGGTGICFGGYSSTNNSVQIADGMKFIVGSGVNGSTVPSSAVNGQLYFYETANETYPIIGHSGSFKTPRQYHTITYVQNNIVTSEELAKTLLYRIGDIAFLRVNSTFAGVSSGSAFVSVGTIPFSMQMTCYQTVPMQTQSGFYVVTIAIGQGDNYNEIWVYKPNTNSGWVRATIVAPIAATQS